MLKYKGTYEIISPDDIGLTRANEFGIVLGKLRYHATHLPLFSSTFSKKKKPLVIFLQEISVINLFLLTWCHVPTKKP
jgi:hypothetical protein